MELLGRKEFAELWVLKWAELLQIRSSNQVSYKATLLYYNWLEDKIARNKCRWTAVSAELLAASGGNFKNHSTNYYQNVTHVLKLSENTAQVFLGMRIQCRVPQPPVRPMDSGRLLQLRRLLLADRPQGHGRPA